MAAGRAAADAGTAMRGDTGYGICSTQFLERFFRTDSYRVTVTTLRRIGEARPNP